MQIGGDQRKKLGSQLRSKFLHFLKRSVSNFRFSAIQKRTARTVIGYDSRHFRMEKIDISVLTGFIYQFVCDTPAVSAIAPSGKGCNTRQREATYSVRHRKGLKEVNRNK
mmetsp:Transcript_9536/g.20625  ORF Transcript_9536/g.20625 Transcript_9536/m.20625 type:complete len:110 (-) Transcript_9536:465-794(-)